MIMEIDINWIILYAEFALFMNHLKLGKIKVEKKWKYLFFLSYFPPVHNCIYLVVALLRNLEQLCPIELSVLLEIFYTCGI